MAAKNRLITIPTPRLCGQNIRRDTDKGPDLDEKLDGETIEITLRGKCVSSR
jgi:hypothetical protein